MVEHYQKKNRGVKITKWLYCKPRLLNFFSLSDIIIRSENTKEYIIDPDLIGMKISPDPSFPKRGTPIHTIVD
jgi:hypothetical protein